MGEPDRKPHATAPTDPLVTRETGPTGDGSLIETDLSAAAGDTDDSLLAAVAAAPPAGPEHALAAGTVLGEAFRIERQLGAGGMGVVYLARDQSLDRPVAVKVHKAGAGVDRLQREAMAMARLAHPNVMTVHEVGRLGDRVFVAMEYVGGGTFRDWLRAAPRTWREALAMLLAAGAGLAAAHDAGLVHRDFKPENILVGEDGRPRVGDFGLARALGDERPEPDAADAGAVAATTSGSGRLSDRLTVTGAMLGTPAYMPLEQLEGGEVDARADQFAFAVATWEALYGARPFTGKDPRALRAAIAAGPPPPPRGSPVPVAVHRALARALAAERGARFPSMRALLDALAAAARPRRRWPRHALAAGALGAGAIGLALVLGGDGAPAAGTDPCVGATAEVDAALPETLIARLRGVVAGLTGDREALARIDAELARTRGDLADAARAVCKASRVTRDLSPELEVRARGCLRYRARAAAVVLDDEALLREAPATFAMRMRGVPSRAACLDAVALAATPPPPAPAELEARALVQAALADIGSDRIAAAEARLAQAEATGQAATGATAALAQLVRGQLAYHADRHQEAERLITDAYYGAQAVDDVEVYLLALSTLIQLHGDDRFEPTTVAPWARTAEAIVQKDRRRARLGVTSVLRALAAAAERRGDGAAAVRWAEQAGALVEGAVDPIVRADVDAALAEAYASVGRFDDAIARYRAYLPVFEKAFGASHPTYAAALTAYALTLQEGSHGDEADRIVAQSRTALAAWPSARSRERARALNNLGVLLSNRPDTFAEARAAFVEARDVQRRLYGPDHPDVALAEVNIAVVDNKRGDARGALAAFERALAIQVKRYGAEHVEVAATQFNIAAAALALDERERARAAAHAAAEVYARQLPGSERHAFALTLEAKALVGLGRAAEALGLADRAIEIAGPLDDGNAKVAASIERARALVALGADLAEAIARLEGARAAYAPYPDVFGKRLVEIDALLATARRASR